MGFLCSHFSIAQKIPVAKSEHKDVSDQWLSPIAHHWIYTQISYVHCYLYIFHLATLWWSLQESTIYFILGPKLMFAERDKHYPSRFGQTSLDTAVTNITKPVAKISFGPNTWGYFSNILRASSGVLHDNALLLEFYQIWSRFRVWLDVNQNCIRAWLEFILVQILWLVLHLFITRLDV